MSFWSTSTEPKRNFRYKIVIEGISTVSNESAGDQAWYAKKATKPSFTVGEVKANFLDKTFYYPGRVEWNTVEITFYDPNNPNVVNHLAQMFANSGYFIPTDTSTSANYGTTSKTNATNSGSVGYVHIITLDQDGNHLEQWELQNAFIKSMKFGDLSYDSDDMTEVTVEFRYDWAILNSTTVDDQGNEKTFTAFSSSAGKFGGGVGATPKTIEQSSS